MAYMEVPKDLEKVKTKIVFGMTKRQLIGFGSAAALGFPIYLLTSKVLPNEISMVFVFLVSMPCIMMGIFERDGIAADEMLKSYLKFKYISPPVREYAVTKQNAFLRKGVRKRHAK